MIPRKYLVKLITLKTILSSHRSPVKSMFMGVVGRVRPGKNIDGRIFLERVSKSHYGNTKTAHQ